MFRALLLAALLALACGRAGAVSLVASSSEVRSYTQSSYLSDMNLDIDIVAPSSQVVRITILLSSGGIERCGSTCGCDWLRLYNGPSTSSTRLANLCGSSNSYHYDTSTDVILLNFRTDSSVQPSTTPFKLCYQAVSPSAPFAHVPCSFSSSSPDDDGGGAAGHEVFGALSFTFFALVCIVLPCAVAARIVCRATSGRSIRVRKPPRSLGQQQAVPAESPRSAHRQVPLPAQPAVVSPPGAQVVSPVAAAMHHGGGGGGGGVPYAYPGAPPPPPMVGGIDGYPAPAPYAAGPQPGYGGYPGAGAHGKV